MQESGEGPQLALRFRELPYTIETGEAEMIGVDFVAKGAGNATATNGAASSSETAKTDTKGKGKGKAGAGGNTELDFNILSAEDEELIASLTTKANAIRMLQQRITLTRAYINSIPPCYLNTPQSPTESTVVTSNPQISHAILRSISATLARLPLLTPPTSEHATAATSRHTSTFTQESAQQKSDVALVSLLGSLGTTLRSAQDMGKKAGVVERARMQSAQSHGGFGNKSKMALRGGVGDDYGGYGDTAAFTPPTDFNTGDDDEMDDFGNDGAGGALRGKGKELQRPGHNPIDEDAEMT